MIYKYSETEKRIIYKKEYPVSGADILDNTCFDDETAEELRGYIAEYNSLSVYEEIPEKMHRKEMIVSRSVSFSKSNNVSCEISEIEGYVLVKLFYEYVARLDHIGVLLELFDECSVISGGNGKMKMHLYYQTHKRIN